MKRAIIFCLIIMSSVFVDAQGWIEYGGANSLAANGNIQSICMDALGNTYVAGYFTNSSGKRYVAKWNGTTWTELGGMSSLAANLNIYTI